MCGQAGRIVAARPTYGDSFPGVVFELDCDPGREWGPYSVRFVRLLDAPGDAAAGGGS
jgi:hypothetical protein